jgi:hypothetical protein
MRLSGAAKAAHAWSVEVSASCLALCDGIRFCGCLGGMARGPIGPTLHRFFIPFLQSPASFPNHLAAAHLSSPRRRLPPQRHPTETPPLLCLSTSVSAPGRRPPYLRARRRRPTGTPPIRCISTSVTAPGRRPPYPRARRRRPTGNPPLRCLSMSVTAPRSRPLHQPLAANQGRPSVAMRRSRTEGNISGCHKNN